MSKEEKILKTLGSNDGSDLIRWHRELYDNSYAPSPGDTIFCDLLAYNVEWLGVGPGIDRTKKIVEAEIKLYYATRENINYFRAIYLNMPLRGRSFNRILIDDIQKTPFNTDELQKAHDRIVELTPNQNTLKSVKRFAWWPTNINNGVNWIFMRSYIEVYQWVSVGKWRSTGKKFN